MSAFVPRSIARRGTARWGHSRGLGAHRVAIRERVALYAPWTSV